MKECRICNSNEFVKTYKGKDVWNGVPQNFNYFECSNCGCIQIEDYPKNIAEFYGADYYSFNVSKSKSGLKKKIISLRNRYYLGRKSIISYILSLIFPSASYNIFKGIKFKRELRILDVGCGDGTLVRDLQDVGYNKVIGIDPFLERDIDNDIDLHKTDIYSIAGEFDVVIMKGTLEHQPNQDRLFSKVNDLLSKNGVFTIRIPVVPNIAFNEYAENWAQFDSPRHFYLHTKKSLQHLADKSNLSLVNYFFDSDLLQQLGSHVLSIGYSLSQISELLKSDKATYTSKFLKSLEVKVQEGDRLERGDVIVAQFMHK